METENSKPKLSDMEILGDLRGTVCRSCSKGKPSMMSHCNKCYRKLPPEMKKALYQKFGNGYETAYTNSLDFLQSEVNHNA